MAKRLTKLRIDSVDAVDRGAGEGVKVMIMKRDGARRWDVPRGYRWNDAYDLVPVDDADRQAASVAKAMAEIEANKAAIGKAAPRMEDIMTDDIIGTMSDRVAEIAKAAGCTTEAAMMRLAESRAPEDQELWRTFKENTAPASTEVGKEFDPAKSLRKMEKRVDQILATDPSVRTRESAIAKIASSRDPADQQLWARYRASGEMLDNSTPAPVGKASAA